MNNQRQNEKEEGVLTIGRLIVKIDNLMMATVVEARHKQHVACSGRR